MFAMGIGLTFLPMIPTMFGDKHPQAGPGFDINYVRIGVGLNSTDAGPNTLNGTVPGVTLYNSNGDTIDSIQGWKHVNTNIEDDLDKTLGFDRPGQFTEVKVKGRENVDYIRISAGPDHPICISWVALTASSSEWRGWNGGFGMRCGLPHYPSTATIPNTDYTPPCVWISGKDDHLPKGVSWRVRDFAPPDGASPQGPSPNLKALATQWDADPDTLCKAPGRMQFWDWSGVEHCVPYFPQGLEYVNGTDKDKDKVMNGHRQKCNNNYAHNKDVVLYDMAGKVLNTDSELKNMDQDPAALEALNKQVEQMKEDGAIFSSTLQLGPLAPPPPKQKRGRVGKRSSDGMEFIRAHSDKHEKCVRELVLHNRANIRVREMCDSPSSWGPDMASHAERWYCDMCTHESYKYCDNPREKNCWDEFKHKVRKPKHGKIRGGSSYPLAKRYETIHQWD